MVSIIVALGASGAALYTHVHDDGLSTAVHQLGFNQTGRSVAEDELLAAGTQLQSEHQVYHTYRRSNVTHFAGMSFGYVSDDAYCLQVVKGGHWYHMAGPEGIPLDGAC
jgi:hypothetical protein